MTISKPIFIIGAARSGTTVLYELFTKHKDTAFFERYSNKFYMRPWLFKTIPYLLKYQKLRYGIDRPNPSEGLVWEKFFDPLEYLEEKHVTDKMKKYYDSIINTELNAFNAKRFVNKSPRLSLRLKWINKMYPDAYYIVIWRDPKAIVNSLYQKIIKEWERGPVIKYVHGFKGHQGIVEAFSDNGDKFEACINYNKFVQKTLKKDIEIIDKRSIQVNYEQFVKSPRTILEKLYNFVELEFYDELKDSIPEKLDLKNNDKWKNLPESQLNMLKDAFSDSINNDHNTENIPRSWF